LNQYTGPCSDPQRAVIWVLLKLQKFLIVGLVIQVSLKVS